jgi:hypothetical protein
MMARQLNRACHAAAQAEIGKRVTLHALRHSFAARLLEHNVSSVRRSSGHMTSRMVLVVTRGGSLAFKKTLSGIVARGQREIPIAPDAPLPPNIPQFPPLEVFVRRPPRPAVTPTCGRHPKTFT